VSSNDFSDGGMGRLAGVLGDCKALTRLNLNANPYSSSALERMAEVLKECKWSAHLQVFAWGRPHSMFGPGARGRGRGRGAARSGGRIVGGPVVHTILPLE